MADDSLVDQALAAGLVQPDQTTCGSSVLVVSRMLNHPPYAGFLVNGANPATGERAGGTIQDRFKQQVLAMHGLTSGFKDSHGGWQLPWPTSLGTRPWALAQEMTNEAGEKGKKYAARLIVPGSRASTFGRIGSLARTGHAVPLFVGNRWSPRHVVLVLPTQDIPQGEVEIYDPASGQRYPIAGGDFSAGSLQVAGWQVPWVVVVSS